MKLRGIRALAQNLVRVLFDSRPGSPIIRHKHETTHYVNAKGEVVGTKEEWSTISRK